MPSLLVLLGINKVLIVYFCWFFSPLQELVQWHGLHLLVELFQENMEMGCQKVLELHWRYFPQLLEKKGGGDELEGAEQQPRASQLEHTVALASHDLGRAPLSPAQVFAAGQASVSPS